MTLMTSRLVILLLILSPLATEAQLQLESKQVSELATNIHSKSIPLCEATSSEVLKKVDIDLSNSVSSANSVTSISILYSANEIPAYQPRHYGVFCRIESKIEKKSRISPRFRLGSSAYVDMLEGKF